MIPPILKFDNSLIGALGALTTAVGTFLGIYYGTYKTRKKESDNQVEIERLKKHESENMTLKQNIDLLKKELSELHEIRVSYEQKLVTAKVTFKVVLNQMKRTTEDKDIVAMMEEVGQIFENM